MLPVSEYALVDAFTGKTVRTFTSPKATGQSGSMSRVGGEKSKLSGGECQKIAIARALLRNAEVLILDEPTNHLDEAAKQWLMDFIRNFDQTMIYVSHEGSMIQLADRKIAVQR